MRTTRFLSDVPFTNQNADASLSMEIDVPHPGYLITGVDFSTLVTPNTTHARFRTPFLRVEYEIPLVWAHIGADRHLFARLIYWP